MKVALFHSLPPGGARRTMFEIVRRLDHEVDLYTIDLGRAERWPMLADQYDLTPYVHDRRSVSIRTPPLPGSIGRVWAAETSVRSQRRLAADMNQRGYDVVIAQHEQFMSTPSIIHYTTVPTVYVCHEPRRRSFEFLSAAVHPRGVRGWVSRAYERSVRKRDVRWARDADVIVANSYFSAESIMRAYGRESTVCYLGVDADCFGLGTADREGVLAVGALDELKGHRALIEAIGGIDSVRRPQLTIVYERAHPPYEAEIRRLADRLHVELVLRRQLTQRELVAAYQAAKVTACIAYLEPFGLSALESMSCGTPVVAVREGGFPESVTASAGVCVPRSGNALTEHIEAITSGVKVFDPVAVRDTVSSFWTWDAAAERFDQLLHDVHRRRR